MTDTPSNSLPFLRRNARATKPRRVGLTEVRGPYYDTFGPSYVEDLLVASGEYIDWLKIPGPAIALLPRPALLRLSEICHAHNVLLSAGGLIELVVTQGPAAVDQYFDTLVELGFDVVEVSAGMISIPTSDYLRLVQRAKKTGLTVKAEVGIQFGAGGTSDSATLAAEGTGSVSFAIQRGRAALEAGADLVILESEGVTESVKTWRTDVVSAFAEAFGLERLLFEAADPRVFEWYIKNFGADVNLFVDHSQVLLLESVRSGIWGSHSLWNRVVTYKGQPGPELA
jgi:phosphosulfolactate synthase (CoM biosynthesis protein A)